jgi:hypothetical protein
MTQERLTLAEYKRQARKAAPERDTTSAHDSLVRACVDYLTLLSVPAYPINQVPRRRKDGTYRTSGAPSGFPDIVACLPSGRMLAVECKTGKARLRKDQVRVLQELCDAGALVVRVRSVDDLWDALRDLLREQGRTSAGRTRKP